MLWTARARRKEEAALLTPPAKNDRRPVLHLLHIGKTAGTALADTFERLNKDKRFPVQVLRQRHRVRLSDLPADDPFMFCVRDPVSRFVSGFYSRKRKGAPRLDKKWSESETRAFGAFPHANDLAEAIFESGPRGIAAVSAMKTIGHVGTRHLDWFADPAPIFESGGRMPAFILRQSDLEADLHLLLRALGYQGELNMPTDPGTVHANSYENVPPLSGTARANLQRWYSDDIAFVSHCLALAERLRDRAINPPAA